ncbi:hypothetical protein ElyMa_004332500 [Elysia marginata]|uniref:Uncharacterized protein n=1 Tax=Elysia marginata TaxID=1093978 RepID=A0AAV4H0B0_9GAST|nr:hypothetical protein ElyMa_004332500 [Elysia marginata]
MDGMDKFYLEGPLCSVAMWSCMERISNVRQTCGDKELTFLMASVQTLCNLSEFGLTDKRCYTRTVEALYATYVNMFPPANKVYGIQDGDFCESYKAKMSKTYLCADDACSYDQKIVLERFQPWSEIVQDATSVIDSCNMTDLCQYEDDEDYLEEIEEEIEEEYGDYAYDYYDSDYSDEEEEEEEEDDEEQEEGRGYGEVGEGLEEGGMGETFKDMMGVSTNDGTNTGEKSEDVDSKKPDAETLATEENIVLGLVVVIAMAGVLLMCLVVVICKRYQSSPNGGHRGYSKLMEEESRMMHGEYS